MGVEEKFGDGVEVGIDVGGSVGENAAVKVGVGIAGVGVFQLGG